MRNIPSSQIPVNSEMIAHDLLRQIAQARIGSGLNKHREVLPRADAGDPETKKISRGHMLLLSTGGSTCRFILVSRTFVKPAEFGQNRMLSVLSNLLYLTY